MNIFEYTFEKHKKLMLENFSLLKETELYHATSRENAESIKVNGPDISLSGKNFGGAGKEQGSGFYFYKNKQNALNHAKEYRGEVIIVFDKNIESDLFDIDYEGDYNLVGKYIQDNVDYFETYKKELGILNIIKNETGKPVQIKVYMGSSLGTIPLNDEDVSIGMANKMAFVFKNLEKLDKSKFNEFENEVIKTANILKYNGKEKIFPVRIEDLQGNVIWKK